MSGRLGASDLAATTLTAVYTVPERRGASDVLISACNRTAGSIDIRIAIIDGGVGAVANEDYIEYDKALAANTSYERDDITLAPGDTVAAYASAIGVSVVVTGKTEG